MGESVAVAAIITAATGAFSAVAKVGASLGPKIEQWREDARTKSTLERYNEALLTLKYCQNAIEDCFGKDGDSDSVAAETYVFIHFKRIAGEAG